HLPWIGPRASRVIDAQARAILGRNLAQRHENRGMKLALDVDALACRKGSVEVGGILEFEFRSAHVKLPSSALSESGCRGRSLLYAARYRACAPRWILSAVSSPGENVWPQKM